MIKPIVVSFFLLFLLLGVDATLGGGCKIWKFENFVSWTTTLDVVSKYQEILILKAIFENSNFHKPYFTVIRGFRHLDVRRTSVISSSRGYNQSLYDSAWSSNTFWELLFLQEHFHSFRKMKCFQGSSKTLRVPIWN